MRLDELQGSREAFEGYFPGGTVVKTLPSNAGDMGSIPGWGTKLACPKSIGFSIAWK